MTQKIDMEWVIDRPVVLADKPAKGRYTSGPLARVAVLVPLSFDDYADCLLRAATDEPNWIGKMVNAGSWHRNESHAPRENTFHSNA